MHPPRHGSDGISNLPGVEVLRTIWPGDAMQHVRQPPNYGFCRLTSCFDSALSSASRSSLCALPHSPPSPWSITSRRRFKTPSLLTSHHCPQLSRTRRSSSGGGGRAMLTNWLLYRASRHDATRSSSLVPTESRRSTAFHTSSSSRTTTRSLRMAGQISVRCLSRGVVHHFGMGYSSSGLTSPALASSVRAENISLYTAAEPASAADSTPHGLALFHRQRLRCFLQPFCRVLRLSGQMLDVLRQPSSLMRALLLLAVALVAPPVRAQGECALPEEPPFMFGLYASREELDRTQHFSLNQMGAFSMFYTSRSDIPASAMPHASTGFWPPTDSTTAVLRPLYDLARSIICGVRFPDDSAESIGITHDAARAEVWVEIGDSSLGTRLVATSLPPSAVELFEKLDEIARRSM